MNRQLIPGDVLVAWTRATKTENPTERLIRVEVVQKGSITSAEIDSVNGLARIIVHGLSLKDGSYWYEYYSRTLERGVSIDVTALQFFDTREQIFADRRNGFLTFLDEEDSDEQ